VLAETLTDREHHGMHPPISYESIHAEWETLLKD
jgi:hypothetical protein